VGGVRRRARQTALGLAVGAALVAGATALASGSSVPVSLRLAGSAVPALGEAVRLTASARLPAGDHLLIRAFRTGKPAAKVAECLRSPCSGSYRSKTAGSVGFQASVIKRAETKVTTISRSERIVVEWAPPPPPTPPAPPPPPPTPPAATPGHFAGTIGNAKASLAFDIGADGISMTNLATGEIDESCDPNTYTFWFDSFNGAGPYPVAIDGSFTITGSHTDPTLSYNMKLTGKVTGTTASGILHVDSSYVLKNGTQLNCSSGDQPWTAAKVG